MASDRARLILNPNLMQILINRHFDIETMGLDDSVEVVVSSSDADLSLDEINDMMRAERRMQILMVPEVKFDSCYEHFIEEKPFKYEREHITKFQRPKRGKRK